MMRILVFSDTHGRCDKVINMLSYTPGIDACIHCGDILNDCYKIKETFPELPFYFVCGNNDCSPSTPKDLSIELSGKKFFITHGHLYRVKTTLSELKTKIDNGYDVVVYGHTHIPDTVYYKSGIIINPGTVCSFEPTYAVIEIENGKTKTAILNF